MKKAITILILFCSKIGIAQVGINTLTPTATLEVNGTCKIDSPFIAMGTGSFGKDITVLNGRGIVKTQNTAQMTYYSTNVSGSSTALAPYSYVVNAEAVNFQNGLFTGKPRVWVGDVIGTGEFYKVKVFVISATKLGCVVGFYNDSSTPISFSGAWSLMAVGN